MISSYQHLVQASRKEPEPQRFLFVFCKAELPDDASAAERAAFERGEGGALMPVICVDKTPDEVPYFDVLAEESRATGQDWDMVFVAAMSGRGGGSGNGGELPFIMRWFLYFLDWCAARRKALIMLHHA